MKIMLGQINTTPGDFPGNQEKIIEGMRKAGSEKSDVLLFPELAICGYLSQDLMYHPQYVGANLNFLTEAARASQRLCPNTYVVVGYLDRNHKGSGKPFANKAAVIKGGHVIATYQKQLLPFYDVFDEGRYFEPGTEPCVLEICGEKVGIAICEDVWNDKGQDDYKHRDNPMSAYRKLGVKTILSLNASPYVKGKRWDRVHMLSEMTHNAYPVKTIAYCNQMGGQDELVFDGGSFLVQFGDLKHINLSLFQETSYTSCNTDCHEAGEMRQTWSGRNKNSFLESYEPKLYDMLLLGLSDYAKKSGFKEMVFGSSGGVDSALVACLAADAVGSQQVHAIRMPSVYSSEDSSKDALELHKALGIKDYHAEIDFEPLVDMLNRNFTKDNQKVHPVADENIQARLRDIYIMHFSNGLGPLPLATGNKTEAACGYYTHFDMNMGYAPLKDVYKLEIFEMARKLVEEGRIPKNIVDKPPSAELSEGQTDEESLLPYWILDLIVESYIEDYVSDLGGFKKWLKDRKCWHAVFSGIPSVGDKPELTEQAKWVEDSANEKDYLRILKLINRNEYKRRQTCPGTKVTKVAFGIGRRIPIVEKWT